MTLKLLTPLDPLNFYYILGLILGQVLVTDGCPACVTVDHLPGPDDLTGVYK